MTYVKTQLPTLKTNVVNLKRDAKDLSRDLQRLEVRGKLGSKTLYLQDGISRALAPFTCCTIFEKQATISLPHQLNKTNVLLFISNRMCLSATRW